MKLLREHWKAISIAICFLIATHVLYRIPAPCYWLETDWEAGDLLTFVGTIVLGYVAYWQNKLANEQADKANETSDRLLRIGEDRYKLELRPFIMVDDYSAYIKNNCEILSNPDKTYIMVEKPAHDDDNVLCIEFSLMNTTNSYVSAKYASAEFLDIDNTWGHTGANQKDDIVRLNPGESKPYVLFAPPDELVKLISHKIKLRFILENRISERYAEYFHIIITSLTGNVYGCSPTGKWHISMFIQEYSINGFKKDKDGNSVEIQEDSHNG
jgi:hypothetical protein